MSLARGLWVLTLGAALAGSVAYWWLAGRPQDLVAAPAGKLACVSYTPFRGSESPFDPTLVVRPARAGDAAPAETATPAAAATPQRRVEDHLPEA